MRIPQPSHRSPSCRRRTSLTQALPAAAVLAALAAPAPAQQQFGNFFLNGFPSSGGTCALGDVNGDGHPDIVVGVAGGQNRLYLDDGDGTGIYTDATAARMPIDTDNSNSVVLGDVDGDGDLDIVLGNGANYTGYIGQQNRLYLNDGTGTFTDVTAAQMPTDTDPTSAVVLGDVDGDGDLDLTCGNCSLPYPYSSYPSPYSPVDHGVQNRLYLNNGTGMFTDATATHMPADSDPTSALVLGDVDGDGDLDLAVGNSTLALWGVPSNYQLPIPFGVQDRLYLNDGTGRFTDATATQLPVDADGTKAVALGDVDGDGDGDLILGNMFGLSQNRLYLNDGIGRFTDVTAALLPVDTDVTQAVALADLDGDGDLDLAIGNAGQNRLYLNNGQGAFTDATNRMPVDTSSTISVAVGDLDRDGDLDILFGNSGRQNRLISNMQRQLFARAPTIGQTWRLDVYARHGPQGVTDVALPILSLGPAPFPIPIPPFGTIGIDLNQMLTLPPFVVPQPAGIGSLSTPVPNNPALVGFQVYSQALLIQDPVQVVLTNVVRSVVQ